MSEELICTYNDGFRNGMFVGAAVSVAIVLILICSLSEQRVFPEKVAIEKGAAVYRIKPGTLNQIEFVWKCDLEKEEK